MSEKKNISDPPRIISDEPFNENNANSSFRFDVYADTLAELIAFKENKTPLTIGVYGSWGSGKTSLMKMIEERLKELSEKDGEFRNCKSVWFQPWKHSGEEAILSALIEEIFRAMKSGGFLDDVKANMEELSKRLDKKKIISALSKAFTGDTFDITDFFEELAHKDKLGFYSSFEPLFADLIWCYVRDLPKMVGSEQPDDKKGTLVIFIDDLDRCPQTKIIEVLETIKLFMNQPGCIFIIGVAKEVVEAAVAEKGYEKEDAEFFMQKIVQVTFNLPPKSTHDIENYLKTLVSGQTLLLKHSGVIARSLKFNPRGVKRFLNNLSLRQSLLLKLPLAVNQKDLQDALLRWAIMEISFHGFTEYIKENQRAIQEVQSFIENLLKNSDINLENWRPTEKLLTDLDEPIRKFAKDLEFINLIREFPQENEIVKAVVELSKTLVQPKEIIYSKKTNQKYNPDAMIEIPKGLFLYGGDKWSREKEEKKIDNDFKIDVYPVTNERYKRFISDGGYEKGKYWTEEGWNWKEKNEITQPGDWDNPKFNEPDQPVVGVSWYEAEAFAKWEGKRLPIEEEWERAARGTKGQIYPWGDEFDSKKCNTEKSEIGKTTPVTHFSNGVSPSGCYDMAGNIFEWTNSGKIDKVFRGGSWDQGSDAVRCDWRVKLAPDSRSNSIGFRCAK